MVILAIWPELAIPRVPLRSQEMAVLAKTAKRPGSRGTQIERFGRIDPLLRDRVEPGGLASRARYASWRPGSATLSRIVG